MELTHGNYRLPRHVAGKMSDLSDALRVDDMLSYYLCVVDKESGDTNVTGRCDKDDLAYLFAATLSRFDKEDADEILSSFAQYYKDFTERPFGEYEECFIELWDYLPLETKDAFSSHLFSFL